jgi:hypothetical protein
VFGIYVSITDLAGAIGCLVVGAIGLLCCLLFFGWLAGIAMSNDALKADVPGSIHTVSSAFSGPAHSSPTTMPCFRSKPELAKWIALTEKDENDTYGGNSGFDFADKHQLLQLNGGEQVRILEEDGHTLRVRVLPLPRGETFDDFIEVHRRDIGQRCYTVDEYDLFERN